MPIVETEVKLDFKDVLIRPKRSFLASRSAVSVERTFTFTNSKQTWTGVPIIAANMDTVGTFEVAEALAAKKCITAIHKHYSVEQWTEWAQGRGKSALPYVAVSTGILKKDMDKADTCEKNAVTMYNDAKKSLEGQISTLQTDIDGGEGKKGAVEGLKGEKAGKNKDKAEKSTDQATKKEELEAIEKKMEDAKPFCDFIINKFDERLKSRVKELEGLNKAKEILDKYKPAPVTKTQG